MSVFRLMFDCRWYEENWREQNLLPNLYRLNGQHGRFGGGERVIIKDGKEDYPWFIESTIVTADITLTENYSER